MSCYSKQATQVLFVNTQNFVSVSSGLGGCGSKKVDIPSKYIRYSFSMKSFWSKCSRKVLLTLVIRCGLFILVGVKYFALFVAEGPGHRKSQVIAILPSNVCVLETRNTNVSTFLTYASMCCSSAVPFLALASPVLSACLAKSFSQAVTVLI